MIVKASRGGCGNRDWLAGNADWDSCLVGTIHALSKRPVSYLSAGARILPGTADLSIQDTWSGLKHFSQGLLRAAQTGAFREPWRRTPPSADFLICR